MKEIFVAIKETDYIEAQIGECAGKEIFCRWRI